MSWFAVISASDNSLISVGTVLADPLPPDLIAIDFGKDRPDDGNVRWNPATLTFDPFTPPPPSPDALSTLVDALTKIVTLDDVKTAAVATKVLIDAEKVLDVVI